MERSLRSVMFLADQTSKKMVEEAKNKANEIVNNARLEGEKVVEGLQSKIQNTRQQLQQMEGQAADLGLSIRGMIEQQEAFLAVQKKTLEATLLGDLPENDAEAAPVADGPAEGAMDLEEQETRVIPAVDMEEDAADDAELAQDDMPLGE